MKQAKKNPEKPPLRGRYFFTANADLGSWIEQEAAKLGLEPPEFIRMTMFKAMKDAVPNV